MWPVGIKSRTKSSLARIYHLWHLESLKTIFALDYWAMGPTGCGNIWLRVFPRADKFVCRFNAPTANRITAYSITVIMYSFTVVPQVTNEFSNFFFCQTTPELHSLKSPNHIIHLSVKKPGYRAFHPFQAFLRFFTVLQAGHLMDMLRTMEIVQNFYDLRQWP